MMPCLAAAASIIGTAASAQSPEPTALSEAYGNWTVACQLSRPSQDAEPVRVCSLRQDMQMRQDGRRVLLITVTRNTDDGAAKMTAVAPLGVDLSKRFVIQANEESVIEGTYSTCLPYGCAVEMPINMEQIARLAAQETARAWMVANGRTEENLLTIDFQMAGFMDGWNRLVDLTGG